MCKLLLIRGYFLLWHPHLMYPMHVHLFKLLRHLLHLAVIVLVRRMAHIWRLVVTLYGRLLLAGLPCVRLLDGAASAAPLIHPSVSLQRVLDVYYLLHHTLHLVNECQRRMLDYLPVFLLRVLQQLFEHLPMQLLHLEKFV